MGLLDWAALGLFMVVWLGYEPLLAWLARRGGALAGDMQVIRAAWMRAMAGRRDTRLIDGQLLGHVITSSTFFISSNLILIAAVGGVLFGGRMSLHKASEVGVTAGSLLLLQIKLALVLAALARGVLALIWAIRQLNYCLALIGAAPDPESDPKRVTAYAEAATGVLNPALSAFSHGVRAYYFALAAAGWLFGPIVFAVGTLASFALLVFRQSRSPAAKAVKAIRVLLEE